VKSPYRWQKLVEAKNELVVPKDGDNSFLLARLATFKGNMIQEVS
jgi:hypothetical protein